METSQNRPFSATEQCARLGFAYPSSAARYPCPRSKISLLLRPIDFVLFCCEALSLTFRLEHGASSKKKLLIKNPDPNPSI